VLAIKAHNGGTMTVQSIFHNSGGLAAIALFMAMASPFMMAQTADSKKISALFTDAKGLAALAEDHAATLETFTRSRLAWTSHAVELNAMKEHVNDLGKVSQQLSDQRDLGSPWQQEAIGQIDPLLRDMADQLSTTINHLNDNHSRTELAMYRDYLQANHDLASRTTELMNDIVEYDRSNSKARAIEQKLEFATDKGE
jgi:hypothetical protein